MACPAADVASATWHLWLTVQAREKEVPESEYTTLPNGLKVFDVVVGKGPVATKGARVAVSAPNLTPFESTDP